MTRERRTAGSSIGTRCLDIRILAVVAVCGGLLASATVAGETEGQLLIPPDEIPAALDALGSLDIARGFALSPDGRRAAIGVPDPLKPKGGYVRFTAEDGSPPADVAVKGHVLQLLFDPSAPFLYAVAQRVGRKGPLDAFVVRVDLSARSAERLVTLPVSASDLSIWIRRPALLVSAKDEVRSVLLPLGRSGPLYQVPGDNRAVASLPGSDRVLVGQELWIVLIDLSDTQGPDGMPIREKLDVPAPVTRIMPSPEGDAALVRLDDGRVFTLRLDPMRLEDERSADWIAWTGEPVAYGPAVTAPPVAEKTEPVEPAPTPVAGVPSDPEVPRDAPEPAPAPEEVVETEAVSSPPTPEPEVVQTTAAPPEPAPEIVERRPAQAEPKPEVPEKAAAPAAVAVAPVVVREPPEEEPSPVEEPPVPEPAPVVIGEATAEEPKVKAEPGATVDTSAPTPPEPAPAEPVTGTTTASADPSKGDAEGKLTGPALSEVVAVVLHGPNNIMREAARTRPESDGTWSAFGLEPGRYRVLIDGGGGRVLQTQPAFRTIEVKAGSRVMVEAIEVFGSL